MTMVPALITMAVVPFVPMAVADLNVGPLFIFAIASLSVYGITLAGWSSNSKYPFFGGVRSCAQMISYEIALGLSVIPVLMMFGTLNLGHIGLSLERWWMLIPLGISFFIFTTSIFAETNRTPFDLPECETELVGGYHTEYSSMKFALFFLGEYAAMIIGSALIVTLFFGGWSIGFGIDSMLPTGAWWTKVTVFILFFILVRWTVPRFRYDQLMNLGWIVFFEAALINVFVAALIL
ncbi:UNVERIFIED_CONTAM: hypothetical protein GTU68_011238, partial [Idotea baltica]|nr:hypothetical protein [Idotea baltica]